jgi:hypothetical protein
VILQEPGEAILRLIRDESSLPPIDSLDVFLDEVTKGVIFYTAIVKQPPCGQPASIIVQLYLDGQPQDRKIQQLVLPALVMPGPEGFPLHLSQNLGVYIEAPATLPPGRHTIAIHGGAFQNEQQNAAVIISQRKLSFLPLTTAQDAMTQTN